MAATKNLTARHKRLLAYAHPRREKIFTLLTERTASPSEITRALGLDRKDIPNVSHHVKKLVELDCAELVDERKGSTGLTESFYKASERALVDTADWDAFLAEDPGFAEHIVGRGFQVQLDDFLLAGKARTIGEDPLFHLSRTRRVLDEEGLLEALEIDERCRREKDEVERRSAERRSESGEDAVHVSDSLALFRVPQFER